MNDLLARQERFLRHAQPRQFGNLSTNLNRIALYTDQGATPDQILYFINESKHFTEWTALDANLEIQIELLEMQRQISRWTMLWNEVWNNLEKRQEMQAKARAMSEKLLEWAGLN